MYKLIRSLFFLGDAETIHNFISSCVRLLGHSPFRQIVQLLYGFEDKRLEVQVFGASFKNPIGLAAGLDKNASMIPALSSLGFGFLEVGTVTPLPQEGNPRPRLFRLPQDNAIINRMGFNGKGSLKVKEKIERFHTRECVLGVNIGKNKITPYHDAVSDYVFCFKMFASCADFVVVNVSSPNTPNLRALQEKEALTKLLMAVQAENKKLENQKSLLLKVSPDLTEGELDDVIIVARETKIAGIIATNTTIFREGLKTSHARIHEIGMGGLSGEPLREQSNRVIRYLYKQLKGSIPIIGVGGILSAEDAYEKICAGATLVELYTGLIYEGPGLVKKIKKGLVKLLERDGFSSVADAVGSKNI